MLMCFSRKNALFKEMERAKFPLPAEGKGYILLRDAQIGPRAWDTMNTRTQGSYDYKTVAKYLRRLERPVPGSGRESAKPLSGRVGRQVAIGEVGRSSSVGLRWRKTPGSRRWQRTSGARPRREVTRRGVGSAGVMSGK